MKSQLAKLLLLSGIVSSILFSCRKNDDQNQPSTTLTLRSYMPKGDFRVFSKGGEVSDPAVIASFIRSSGMQNIMYSYGPQQNAGSTIAFINDTAFSIGLHEYYSYTKLSNGFLFKKMDYNTNNSYDFNLARVNPFMKYPEMNINANGSYTYRRIFAGYGDKSNLNIPGIDLILGKRDDVTGAFIGNYGSFGNTNEFNKEGVKTLGPRDTIIIRETVSNFSIAKP
jgi:hypothetical protein